MADLKLGLRIDASVSRVDEIRKLADDIEALGGDGQQAAADLDKLNQELKLAANQSAAIKSYRDPAVRWIAPRQRWSAPARQHRNSAGRWPPPRLPRGR